MGSALPAVALGAQAFGAIQKGRAQSESDKYNAGVASNNAAIAAQNATYAGEEGEANAARSEQKTRAQVGGIKTNQAAANIDVNSSSAVGVRASAASEGTLDAMTIRSNAARQAYGYQTQQASDLGQAKMYEQESKQASRSGILSAVTGTLLGAEAGNKSGEFDNFVGGNSLPTSNDDEADFAYGMDR